MYSFDSSTAGPVAETMPETKCMHLQVHSLTKTPTKEITDDIYVLGKQELLLLHCKAIIPTKKQC